MGIQEGRLGRLRAMLNSLAGVAYATDQDGIVLACGADGWREFAEGNGAAHLGDAQRVVGRCLFRFVTGRQVRDLYRMLAERVSSGAVRTAGLSFRCDSASRKRLARLSISRLDPALGVSGLLYQCVTVGDEPRPAIRILSARDAADRLLGRPLLRMCSYCGDVRFPAGETAGNWISASRYYRAGGTENVRLSHGICPTCYITVVRPMLDRYEPSGRSGPRPVHTLSPALPNSARGGRGARRRRSFEATTALV